MTVAAVGVAIFHPETAHDAGPLVRAVAAARAHLAERHRLGFLAAGADEAWIVSGPADDTPFGARLRDLAGRTAAGGLIVLGSGAVPLLTARDRRSFIDAAAADRPGALANNRYSADIVAIARAHQALTSIPDLDSDNALPRWLAEVAGVPVTDLRQRWRLGVDIDGPLDLLLLGGHRAVGLAAADRGRVERRLAAARDVLADSRAELVIAGRTSPAILTWLERSGAARTRAIVEERGLRTSRPGQRPAASVLGALLDRDGAASLGEHLERLGEAAVVDSRVLLAHRLGADPARWPGEEDRHASDLLLHERVSDPWLRALTRSAAEAAVPILLGGHTLVGPGLRLALGPRRQRPEA